MERLARAIQQINAEPMTTKTLNPNTFVVLVEEEIFLQVDIIMPSIRQGGLRTDPTA